MASRQKSISIPLLLIVSCVGIAILLAVLARLTQEPPQQIERSQVAFAEQVSSTMREIVVATSGDLLQSVPPSWTFAQVLEGTKGVSPLNGLTALRELHIVSVETGAALRLVEYSVADLVAYKNDLESKAKELVAMGNISYPALRPQQGTGIETLIIEGTTKVVIVSSGEGKIWPSKDVVAAELGELLQSIRVQ